MKVLILLALVVTVQLEIIERLEDGIVVNKGDDLAIEEGQWTLLLTIEEAGRDFRATERASLIDKVNNLWEHISWQPFNGLFTASRKWLMRSKLDLIREDHEMHFRFADNNR